MSYLKQYVNRIQKQGNKELADSVSKTAEKFGEDFFGSEFYRRGSPDHKLGLLAGNIQSGKTSQVLAIICKAADKGFPVFLLLTTDNNALQQQTLKRAKEDLEGFCVCDEKDQILFLNNHLKKPALIVLKKNARILRNWRNVLLSCGYLKGNNLFIIDDEADAGSLNTAVNKGKKSSINKNLEEIREISPRSFYLQVTGTPQAVLLQSRQSGWHPYFSRTFEPGEGYLGGDFFFPPESKSGVVHFIEEIEDPEQQAVLFHLTASGYILAAGGTVCNALIHPSPLQKVHEEYKKRIEEQLEWCRENRDREFKERLEKVYEEMNPVQSEKIPFEEVYQQALKLLENQVKVLIMNDKYNISSDTYSKGSNIIIGGNSLGRGVTFPRLQTIYYSRTSRNPQADTMWQHSRMFGYDRDPGVMSVFMEQKLYKLFSDINATNNSLYRQIEAGLNDIKFIYPPEIKATRSTILETDKVSIVPGGVNYFPFNPENDSIEDLDRLLEPFDQGSEYYEVGLTLIREILSHVRSDNDFYVDGFLADLNGILADNPIEQGILIVRKNRNITKGSRALLSPDDWELANSFKGKTVLTIYKVTGEKGWNGREVWVPNIKLPEGMNFYHIDD